MEVSDPARLTFPTSPPPGATVTNLKLWTYLRLPFVLSTREVEQTNCAATQVAMAALRVKPSVWELCQLTFTTVRLWH